MKHFPTDVSWCSTSRAIIRGIHKGGLPLYRWMVYFMDNPIEIDDLEVAL